MRISGRPLLHDFVQKYRDSEGWINSWLVDADKAMWTSPHDVKKNYPTADPIGGKRIVFNVHGNKYRMQVKIMYHPLYIVEVEWIVTHAEYTRKLKGK